MDFRLDARLSSGLAYLLTTAALLLLGAGYMVRSRFVVVHVLHSLILLLIQILWWKYVPLAIDFLVILAVLAVLSMKNALQGYCLDWFLFNWLRRWLMPLTLS